MHKVNFSIIYFLIGLPFILSAAELSTKADDWKIRIWGTKGTVTLLQLKNADDNSALIAPIEFPKRLEIVSAIKDVKPFAEATHLEFTFQAAFEGRMALTVFAKDNDHLWRQIRMVVPPSDGKEPFKIKVPLKGNDAVRKWEMSGHLRPWNALTARNLLEYGCIFEPDYGVTASESIQMHLKGVSALVEPLKKSDTPVRDLSYHPQAPTVGTTFELSFRLDCWPSAPYDSAKTKIDATVKLPEEGKTEAIHGFYYEDFLYDSQEWDKTRCLTPSGEPCFKLRYCPRMPGRHTLEVKCDIDGEIYILPPVEFDAQAAPATYHGFVRRDPKHDQFFLYDDGKPFWGLGMNVRSPYDNRYKEVAPYSNWQDMGLAVYDRLFKRYKEVGINVVEVWMCSWWLALEWINDAPGFHGVGHYNQYRAWMLDHIFDIAEQNGIRLILVINNHGKFAMHYDTEWKRNPFNKINGGYLTNCEEYYTDKRAWSDTKKLLDYISARWGATPTLLAWKLFTEVDLTGPDLNFYNNPVVAKWHTEMGSYLKGIDLYKHPITTHWMLSYQRINRPIAMLPELDFLSTDVYYNLGGGTRQFVELMHGSRTFAKSCSKPLVITEFGGSSYADSMTNMMKQVPMGIWTGFFSEMGIIPMYWWFALLEDKSFYSDYVALGKFGADEDRRGMAPAFANVPNTSLNLNTLRSDNRVLAWIFDMGYYFNDTENIRPATQKGAKVTLPAPKPGKYELQFWNSVDGTMMTSSQIDIKDANVTVTLPDFQKHIALKIIESK